MIRASVGREAGADRAEVASATCCVAKGYLVTYLESFGGHDSLFFQLAFTQGLAALTKK
jgi:hypothetical protein